jgi:O-antigen/teichoic acid export membrane protein
MLERASNEERPVQRSLWGTILRNTLFVSSGGGLIRLLSFAYTIFYVRQLGDHVYGQYATVLAISGLFSIFFELGTTQYVERTLAQDRTRLPELIGMLILVRFVLALLSVVALTGMAYALGYDQLIVLCVLVQTISYILAALLAPLMAIFTSHERYDLWTACQMIGQIGTIALGATVLLAGGGLLVLVSTGLLVMLLQIVYCLFVLQRFQLGALRMRFDWRAIQRFLRASMPFALAALALTISFNVDTFLLSLLQPSNVVGWYSAAYRLVPTMVSILGGFLTVITPSLARTYVNDRESVHSWVRTSTKWLAIIGLPLAMGTSLLATPIIALLYGSAFAPAALVLAIISWDIPLRLFNAFAGNVTAAVGLEQPAWRIFMTGALIGLVCYAPAISLFGLLGAAVVTVVTDGINAALFFRLLGKQLQFKHEGALLLRVAGATALMGLLVWLTDQVAVLPVTIGVGVLSYAVAIYALGLVDRVVLIRVAGLMTKVRRAS